MIRFFFLTISAVIASPLHAQRMADTVELYGYTASSGATCSSAFVDIAATGAVLTAVGVGATSALDDGGAVLALAQPFEHFGVAHAAVVVSTNGYLAFSGSLDTDSGTDYSRDCPLPAVPDAGAHADGLARNATPGRVYAHHADLDGTASGAIHAQFFATCPRAASAGGAEACTIVQWTGFEDADGASVSSQVVLFHATHEIAIAWRDIGAAGATIGLQDAGATSAITTACAAPAANDAVCYSDPRFPPGSTVVIRPDALFRNDFE